MPFRESLLGLGFTADVGEDKEIPQKQDPSGLEIIESAFRGENAIYGLTQLQTFEPNPDFDFAKRLKASKYSANYGARFIGVSSDEEFTFMEGKVDQEVKDRAVLAAGGASGMLAGMVAGMLDPTILIPGITAFKVGAGAAKGAALVAAGTAAQETVLYESQVTRTGEESALNIGFSAVLGGILGGAGASMNKAQFNRMADGMARSDGEQTIPITDVFPSSGQPSSAGAAVAPRAEAGKLKGVGGAEKIIARIGPVTRTLQSPFTRARSMMATLEDGGAKLEGNIAGIPSVVGGNVANRAKTHFAGLGEAIPEMDSLYAKYWSGNTGTGYGARVRARIGSEMARVTGSLGGKYTAREFRQAIGEAMNKSDKHDVPEVAAAAAVLRKTVYDPIHKAATEAGMFTGAEKLLGSSSYLNRLYNRQKIIAKRADFTSLLQNNFMQKLQNVFSKSLGKLQEGEARLREDLSDVQLARADAADLKKQLNEGLENLEQEQPAFVELSDIIAELRVQARTGPSGARRDEILLKARDEAEVEGFSEFKKNRARYKSRLRNLDKGRAALDKKHARLLARVDEAEALSQRALDRLVAQGHKLLTRMEGLDDKTLDLELSKFKNDFEKTAKIFDRNEERLLKIRQNAMDGSSDDRLIVGQFLQAKRADTLDNIAVRIEDLDNFDRGAARELISESMTVMRDRVSQLNNRRAVRSAMLLEKAKRYSPEALAKRVAGLEDAIPKIKSDFFSRMEAQGAENIDLKKGVATFDNFARDAAEQTTNKILGNSSARLPGIDIIQGERGPTLARTLDIEFDEIADYLELDVETLAKNYTRTMAPDIELNRAWGSVSGDVQFKELEEEFNLAMRSANTDAARIKLNTQFTEAKTDIAAVIGRLRHNYALPDNPEGITSRLAHIALAVNYMRLMGMVTISSIPDMSRSVMRYGVGNTMKHAIVPMVTNLKSLKLNARQVKLSGTALDMVLDTRQQALADMFDQWQRGTKFERGIEYMSNNLGLVSMMAPWNAVMKQMAGSVAIGKMLDDVKAHIDGVASPKQTEFLAENGFGTDEIAAIWREMQKPGGGSNVDGVWLPNTEKWEPRVATLFRQAIARETDLAIITPGAERPLWQSKLLGSPELGKLIGQLRSFSTSAVSRMLLSGMQQRDMALLNGFALNLALGGVSYYIYAVTSGGRALEEMQKASTAKWIQEMVDRSGVLTVLGDVNRIAERTPLGGLSALTGQQTTRQKSQDIWGAVLGPSADLASKLARVVQGIGAPTQATSHAVRQLLPYQNTFYMRRLWDEMEAGVNETLGIPKRRAR